jgi:carboxymethylenebutenolidase
MPHEIVQLRTEDGVCPTHVFEPDSGNDLPGVIVFMDAFGIRPAMLEIAERLSLGGYCVALPDLYYRSGYTAREASSLFTDEATKADWTKRVVPTVSIDNIMRDVRAIVDHFATRARVRHGKIGTTGYCMGGRYSVAAAGHFPEWVAAAASYHGGSLATDAPDSPHRLAHAMKARVYVGAAIEDRGFDDAQKARLESALTEAHVPHQIETYNARHGWVLSDMPVHDPVAAARHWETLFELFDGTLKGD